MSRNETKSAGVSLALLAVVALGVLLRGVDAARKSLWLDELHSRWFAAADDAAGVVERVKVDFHPPGHFLLLHALRGIDAETLRWTSILASLATLVPLLALCRAAGLSRVARVTAAGVFCFAPYQLQYGCELRAYAFLQLVAVTLAWAAFTSSASARVRFAVFAAATAAGLWLHYFTALAVVATGAARLVVARPEWLRWRTLVLAGTLGVALFVPWVLADESWLLSEPGVMFRPESQDSAQVLADAHAWSLRGSDLVKCATLPARLFAPMLRSLGSPSGELAVAGSVAFALLVALSLAAGLRPGSRGALRPSRELTGALLACAVSFLLVAALSLYLWQRLTEQYFVVSAWAWPLVAAWLVETWSERTRGRVAAALLVACGVAGLGHASGHAREDFRAGVRLARELSAERDAVLTAVLAQPPWFSDLTPFVEYAPDLACVEPLDVPRDADTVVVLSRKSWVELQPRKWDPIRLTRRLVEVHDLDESIRVHVYSRSE